MEQMPQQMTTNDPLDAVLARVDELIKAGGATADDLNELKMDLQDCKGGSEDMEPMPPQPDAGIAGLISQKQGG